MLTINDFSSKSNNLSYIYPFEISSNLTEFQKAMSDKKVLDTATSKMFYELTKKEFRKKFRELMESRSIKATTKQLLVDTFTRSNWNSVKQRFGITE